MVAIGSIYGAFHRYTTTTRQVKSYNYIKKSSDPLNLPMTPKFSNKGSSTTPKNSGLAETLLVTGPCSPVGNVSGNRCESDCRSRGRELDPGRVPYFRGD